MGEFARHGWFTRNHWLSHDFRNMDTGDWTVSGAEGAADAVFLNDLIRHQVLADMGWALLLFDVSLIFLWEVIHRREDWVGCGLA